MLLSRLSNFRRVSLSKMTTVAGRGFVSATPLPLTAGASSLPWSLGILNHVAIAVPDIDKSAAFYRDVLKAKVSGKVVT